MEGVQEKILLSKGEAAQALSISEKKYGRSLSRGDRFRRFGWGIGFSIRRRRFGPFIRNEERRSLEANCNTDI